MKRIKLSISFTLVEELEKQEKRFQITDKQKAKMMTETNFIKKHIDDIKKSIHENYTFDDLEYIEDLSVELLEVER